MIFIKGLIFILGCKCVEVLDSIEIIGFSNELIFFMATTCPINFYLIGKNIMGSPLNLKEYIVVSTYKLLFVLAT